MESTELRIGNLVYVKYTDSNDDEHEATTRVLGVHEEAVLGDGWRIEVEAVQEDFYECVCEPIKLTEEILLKSGFAEFYKSDFSVKLECIKNPIFEFVRRNDKDWNLRIKGETHKHIKYLHQLQNLYFALTGTELKIEL